MPQRDPLWKHLLIAGVAASLLYVLGFTWLEHRRVRQGPWEIEFVRSPGQPPSLRIAQPTLGITNVSILFDGISADPTQPAIRETIRFTPGQAVPFDLPFGQCLFMDPLFLPGTVTLNVFDHHIDVLPRTLIIDGTEYVWTSNLLIQLPPSPAGRPSSADDTNTPPTATETHK